MNARPAVLVVALVLAAVVGFVVAGCGKSRSSHLQTTDLPYTVARIKPSITAARASDPGLFSIFPAKVSSRACEIPSGGPPPPPGKKRTLPGTCSTTLAYAKNGDASVSFKERWKLACSSGSVSGTCLTPRQHTWRVIVGKDGKVISTRSSGDAAPQSAM